MKEILLRLNFWLFKKTFLNFLNHDLDQWERWEVDCKYGKAYVFISRESDGYKYDKLKL